MPQAPDHTTRLAMPRGVAAGETRRHTPADTARRPLRILGFGTYDARLHPRGLVLLQGLAAAGEQVTEANVPLGLDTSWRVRILRQPWLAPVLLARLAWAWLRLWRLARRVGRADALVVGYMGHFDVHLGRRLFPRSIVALDHLVWLSDTARDRGASGAGRATVLERIDRAALAAADVVVLDTAEHLALLAPRDRERAVVVPVGAPADWFCRPEQRPSGPLRVVFFGLYTPLQGTTVIARAIARLADTPIHFTMCGRGQEFEEARAVAAPNGHVEWRDWIAAPDLPGVVAAHDVCLGIFGTAPKALRVVPNKVYQGAAAGCAVVTSDTAPQRSALGEAGIFVPPGDDGALADALLALAQDREWLWQARVAASERANRCFRPEQVVALLQERLVAAVAG